MSTPTEGSSNYVFDACALIALLVGEPGSSTVKSLLVDENNSCFIHAINLCEVYYDLCRNIGVTKARESINDLIESGVEVRTDLETAFWQQVGELKVSPGKLALADCFALTLAIQNGATLVTSDHHEFDRIDPLGLCPILFIR